MAILELGVNLLAAAWENTGIEATIFPASVDAAHPARTEPRLTVIPMDGEPKRLRVAAGAYLVTALLPTGERVSRTVSVDSGEKKAVILEPAAAPEEWLRWQQIMGQAPSSEDLARLVEEGRTTPLLTDVTVRLGRAETCRNDGLFSSLPHPDEEKNAGDRFIGILSDRVTWSDDPLEPVQEVGNLRKFENRYGAEEILNLYLVKRNEKPALLGVFPGPWTGPYMENLPVELLLTADRIPVYEKERDFIVRLRISAAVEDPDTALMLSFLGKGNITGAASALRHSKERLFTHWLFNKRLNPLAAAAGAYVMVETVRQRTPYKGRWGDWVVNLSDWFSWLPDGAIALAWYELATRPRHGKAVRKKKEQSARELLIKAVERGVPLYSHGARLLVDGLSLFVGQDRIDQRQDETASRTLRAYEIALWMVKRISRRDVFTVIRLDDRDIL
jgi:hypothetical protein